MENFYPRPPRGGRLGSQAREVVAEAFLSTPSARRATESHIELRQKCHISIHALREEGDQYRAATATSFWYFYPRPPRGGRLRRVDGLHSILQFLSTPSARRATKSYCSPFWCLIDFYPRPPRGGRLHKTIPRALSQVISIHALREEGDPLAAATRPRTSDFYPRPPRGGRHSWRSTPDSWSEFLSTPSARRATSCLCYVIRVDIISIHALREEGDNTMQSWTTPHRYFYPRPPRGGRPHVDKKVQSINWISIHALREEGD